MKGNFYALRRLFSSTTNLFPRFILITVLFFSFIYVDGKTVIVGNGSGNVSQTSMSGLNPGDILAIAPGTYTGGNFSNLSGISIISQSSRVTFTGTVTFGTNTNVSFSGFTITNTGGSGMTWPGVTNGCTISNVSFINIGGNAIDVASGLAYNGSASSLKMYNCKFDSITVSRAGYFLRGSYGQINDRADFSDSVIMTRISIDQTKTNGEQVRGVFFRLYAHDWKVTYSGNNPTGGDVGIFTIFGNACFNNFWQSGGAGYIARIYNASMLGTSRSSYLFDCVRINTTRYGMIDIRIDAANIVAGLTSGTNCYIYNNTAVNCVDDGNYIAPMVVLGLFPGYNCQIKNNLGINLKANSLAQEIIQNNSGGTWGVDTGGNRYYASTTGIVDGTTVKPVTGSPVIGKGVTIPFIKDDYYHTTISGAYDIGAVQTNGVAAAPNQPPVANAGTGKTITLPTNSTNLSGSASSDPDGSIASYSWAQIGGPSTSTITNNNSATPTVGNLVAGTYTFELTVTDNKGATAKAQVTVTVNNAAANQLPVANAGTNKTITLPTNSTGLNGSASSDPDGTIASYSWAQIGGPSTSAITNANTATPTAGSLQAGTYTFELTVTDNSGGVGKAQVTVTVNNAAVPNQSPVANAGPNQTITLPINSTGLNGSTSSDPDGTISNYSWAQIGGPSTSTITNGNIAYPTVGSLQAGTYTFELTVTDNSGATAKSQVTVTVNNPAPNQLPVADAGANQTITLPTNSISLNGTNSSDPDGTIALYAWSQVSGPGSTITNSTAGSTLVNGLTAGTYIFKLVVTDNRGGQATANVTVVVNPAVNIPPTANAGADQTITLPTSSVNVDGSASTDPDGSIASYSWTQKTGPSAATIANAGSANTNITGLAQGTYVFKLLVTDNNGATASDSIIVKVNAAVNQSPVANAGTSKSITLPVNSVNLDGSLSSDPDGTIASYSWAQITGPGASTITNGNTATPTANNLVAGQYTFELTVTDNAGATAKAQVKITVVAAGSLPPVANAGADQTITLPINSVNLNGSGSSAPAGSISTYSWVQTSGPAAATIPTPGNATTAANNLAQGTYVFTLTITDNTGATANDIVTITVNAAPNQAPVANAGASKTITLPTNSVSLSGTASSDPDGTIASYSWAQIAGPSTAVITNGNTATPTTGSLVVGQYTFELTVTDNKGATAKAQVKVTVLSAPNQAPIANAGGDKSITLPTSSVSLSGSASSDPDGTIASYSWVKISGAGGTISNPTTVTPNITGLQAGTYVFELAVTDNKGATAKDQVTVTVNAAVTPPATNQPPVPNAGTDQTITLPTNTVNLNGTNSYDPDGSITSYSWAPISGASNATIANGNTGTPSIQGLIAGTYVFELAVTDNKGATAKDRVSITVKAAPVSSTPAPNQPPVADAGTDQTITLPSSSVMLDGSGSTDPNGTITTYQWQEMSGPNSATLSSFSNATSEVSGLVVGDYMFQLTVTDNNGTNSTATVKVKVVDNLKSTESILLYPNPAHDVVNVRLVSDSNGTVKVNIYDMNGRLVHASEMEKQSSVVQKTINVNQFAGGMYTLQAVIGPNKIMLAKFIKQ